jgi:hypothetical protein
MIVGAFSVLARSRRFASVSLVAFVTAGLLWCDGIRGRYGGYDAEAQAGDSKLCQHAAPERLEASTLRRRQVFRQREERELVQRGAESLELSFDVPSPG